MSLNSNAYNSIGLRYPEEDRTKRVQYLVNLLKFNAPYELKLMTGRVIQVLSRYPKGLSKQEFLREIYPDFSEASFYRKESLIICLNKLIQRARVRFSSYSIGINYDKSRKLWVLSEV
jgi:hypothetical protein